MTGPAFAGLHPFLAYTFMSDVRVLGELFSFVIDPQVYGYDTTNLFTTVTGTPAISSNKIRFTSAEARTKAQYLFGEFVFRMTVPVQPTAGQARTWGLVGVAVGNRGSVRFNVTDDVFSVLAYDNDGTLIQQIVLPWDSDWTAVATDYRIAWSESGVTFKVVGSTSAHIAQANIQFGLKHVNIPQFLVVSNGTADNMDVTYITLNNVGRVESISEVAAGTGGGGGSITSVVPGTGATNLGKSEDAPHASGDVGVEMLAVRRDTAASSTATDGDYATVNTDALGHMWNREGYAAASEDNSNGVTAFQVKPLAVNTYSPTQFANLGANATLNIKASAGNVYSYYAYQTNAAARFEQIHNTATTPGGGAVPVLSFLVPASGTIMIGTDFFTLGGWNLATGIAFGHSTTFGTYTAGTAADGNRFVSYK